MICTCFKWTPESRSMHQEENYVQQLASAELSEQEMEKLKQVLDRAKVGAVFYR